MVLAKNGNDKSFFDLEKYTNWMGYGVALHELICDEQGVPIDYKFVKVNKGFEELTGLESSKIVGKSILEVMPTTEDFWIERYGQVVQLDLIDHFEQYSDVLDKHFSVLSYSPFKDHFITIFSDITKHISSVEQLSELKSSQKVLFEDSPNAIFLLNPNKVIQKINGAALSLFGLDLNEAKGKNIEDLFYSLPSNNDLNVRVSRNTECFSIFDSAVDSALKGINFSNVRSEVSVILKNDEIQKIDILCSASLVHYNGFPFVYINLVDVTDLCRLRTENIDANNRLLVSSKMASLGELSAAITHEINNPLSIISAYTKRLLKLVKDEKQSGYLNKINIALESIKTIIKTVKMGVAGNIDEVAEVMFSESAMQTISLLNELYSIDSIKIECDFVSNDKVKLTFAQIQQILFNLFSNSKDSINEKGEGGKIFISSSCENGFLVIDYRDTGMGFPEKIVDMLFNVQITTKHEGKGTGIGSMVMKTIVADAGGTIEVNRDYKDGAGLIIKIPLI